VTVKDKDKLLVFRANLGFNKKPEAMMKAEKLICEEVEKIGVPTNKILYVDVSRKTHDFDYQIEECLEGSDIENNFKGTREEYDKLSFDLGMFIGTYSKIKFSKFGMFDEKAIKQNILQGSKTTFFEYITTCLGQDVEYLINSKIITPVIGEKIVKLFTEYKSIINSVKIGSLVHHDLADHNIFFSGKQITGIFDWEAAVVGDPILDIASCPTWRTFYPREKKLIEGYVSVAKLPDYFKEKMNIYRLRTMLWKVVYAIRMDILNETRRKTFYEALKPFRLF